MKLKSALGPLLVAVLFCAQPTAAEDSHPVIDAAKDQGVDWLKGKATDAAESWVFDTGQSDTMEKILDAALQRANGENNQSNARCVGCVQQLASTILTNLGYETNVKNAAHLAFSTLTKVAELAASGLGAAAEGGTASWLAKQYADAAAGKGTDKIYDVISKAFIDSKEPEFEIFERTGTVGPSDETTGEKPCSYTLRSVWDKVHNTFSVYIFGDCHCNFIGGVLVNKVKLGAWWAKFDGVVKMAVHAEDQSITFTPVITHFDFDDQCPCNDGPHQREMRSPFPDSPPATAQPGASATTPPTPQPLPSKGIKVCEDCQKIQDQINADWKALEQVVSDIDDAPARLLEARARLGSAQGDLEAFKADPSAYNTTEAAINARIAQAKADIAKLENLPKEKARLQEELRDLGEKLKDCLEKKCPPGHSSVPGFLKDVTGSFTIGIGVGGSSDRGHHRDNHGDQNNHNGDNNNDINRNDNPDTPH